MKPICALVVALSAAAAAERAPSPTPTVVFVGEHGAAKSVIATAYFNKLAAERGLPYWATFRGTAPQEALTVTFDTAPAGQPPAGWTATQTGTGDAKWAVVQDNTAPSKPNVLKQSGQATYPVCLKDDTSLKDGFVEVKFKPISGRTDRAGGVNWRVKDANNYYTARGNALENNVTVYHTINGRRTEKKRVNVTVATNQWHTIRVDFQGPHFTVTFDGAKALEWDDETFREAGKVGLWTKADSVTLFDDFTYGTR